MRVCVCYLFLIDFALQLYFQIEQDIGMESIKLKALLDLFDEIVEEPLFNQLRYLQAESSTFFFF